MARVPYWNIDHGYLIDLLSLPALAIFAYGLYRHYLRIRQGKARLDLGLPLTAMRLGPLYLRGFVTRGLLGSRIYNKLWTGAAHGLLMSGMFLLGIGTTLVVGNVLFKLPIFEGSFNRYFMGLTLDLAGVAALVGLLFLLARRVFPAERLSLFKEKPGFIPVELGLALLLVTGFLIEAARIAHNGPDPGSVVGTLLAPLFGNHETQAILHRLLWWGHGLLALALIAYLPFSPLVHLVLAPVNAGLDLPLPGPKMGVLDFSAFEEGGEEAPSLGIGKLGDFSWKNFLDFSSCLWCGRCHEVCPAAQTGKSLSPKKVMVTLAGALAEGKLQDPSLLDEVSTQAIYECTTCAACLEACPASVNQPNAVLGMRQHLLMERSEVPHIMGQAHRSLEARRHPFAGTGCGPNDWRKDLEVPFFKKGETEYLLWIGCSVAYEERAQNIARSMVKILDAAGVSYGILKDNRCTGDPAKQMGDEFLFTEIAGENVDEFAALGVRKIITLCPHCFVSFTTHYPHLGGNYEVTPHSALLSRLISTGAIRVNRGDQEICYHDPCYLGRHGRIFSEPRSVLASLGRLVEMPRHGAESFCCGAGGGNYWAEEEGTRINQSRAREALDTGAQTIATACPFCLLMLTDGVKKFTEEQKVQDISELVAGLLVV